MIGAMSVRSRNLARQPKATDLGPGLGEEMALFAPDLDVPASDAKSVHGAEGHRQRLRARLMTVGPEALADHELLEVLLFLAVPRRDTKAIAKRILAQFGSFSAALAASPAELLEVEDVGPAAVAAIKTAKAAAERLLRAEIMQRPVLDNWDRVIDYLRAIMSREKIEQFRVLFLDARNRLMADEVQGRGSVSHTPVYPREVVKRALNLHATAMIVVHNHPSGDPTPSREDVTMTEELAQAAASLGIVLHDHVIVGNGTWTSMRREGFLG
jgi:DNA repair protein RadC